MRGAILTAGTGANRDRESSRSACPRRAPSDQRKSIMHACDRCGAGLPSAPGERAIAQAVANEGDSSPRPVVLVADDSELVRRIAETTLSAAGFQVVLAVDGEGALAAAEREAPQVVVLDLLMPKMTGFDVLREMRRSGRLKSTPVLMMSGVYKENVVGFLARLGAQGFVDKETLEENLAFRVGTVLREHAAASSVDGRGAGRLEPELCAACAPAEGRAAAPGAGTRSA